MTPNLCWDAPQKTLHCEGSWAILFLDDALLEAIASYQQANISTIDARALESLDSAGAEMLFLLKHQHPKAQLLLTPEQQNLLKLLTGYTLGPVPAPPVPMGLVARLGRQVLLLKDEAIQYLSFVGESVLLIFQSLFSFQNTLWRNIAKVLETTGFYGMPIIGLLSFLIGVVLAYQMGVQLETYGASIYVVNLLGISILREFAPLLTAIIVAGRTGSAFTAELGTMKVNQELDALATMGVNPMRYLVTPKILGLMFAMPLLSMWAAFAGLLGGMLMSKTLFGISFSVFFHQFQQSIAVKQLFLGLMKTPVFAYVIASIGCFEGMRVQGGAESVGKQTTRSVVASLFLIIVVDAWFSILMSHFHA